MTPGVASSWALSQVNQCSQPLSPWKFLSFLGFQCTLLPCDISFLMGLKKVGLYADHSIFSFFRVETMFFPALHILDGSGIMFIFKYI